MYRESRRLWKTAETAALQDELTGALIGTCQDMCGERQD